MTMKKKLIVGLTLAAAVIATPALSQTVRGYTGYTNGPMMAPGYGSYAYAPRGFGAYSYVPPMVNSPTFSDEYIGTDPDPAVRLQLRRDMAHENY
jgi:hypothetical protein